MKPRWIPLLAFVVALGCSEDPPSADDGDPCTEPDQDGVIGGDFTFELTVSETGFQPLILKAQNSGKVTITLRNTGAIPRGFAIDCLTVNGCTACFPEEARIAPVEPGATRTVTFTAPTVEGIFTFGSGVAGEPAAGQFILQ